MNVSSEGDEDSVVIEVTTQGVKSEVKENHENCYPESGGGATLETVTSAQTTPTPTST